MPEKNEIAKLLAEAHRAMEPAINRIVRLPEFRGHHT